MVNRPRAAPGSPTRLVVQALVSLGLVVAIFSFLLQGIDLAEVGAEIGAMTGIEGAILAAITAWNLATYALVEMAVKPGLGFWRAIVLTQAATAVSNTVPTVGPAIGVGLSYRMLGSWGYSRSRTTVAVLVSGVWNAFVKLGLPVLALALVALQGTASGSRVTAALVGMAGLAAAVVVLALLLRREDLAERFGLWAGGVASRLLGLVGRPPVTGWELATVKFRTRTLELLQVGWVPITAASLVSHLSLYAVLLVTLHQVGVSDAEISWAQVLAVFAVARLATIISFLPGGAGLVELVLIAGLTAAGGDREQATAAVLVYRALTWGLPILIGIGCYLWWRSWLRTPSVTASGPLATIPTGDPQRAVVAADRRPRGRANPAAIPSFRMGGGADELHEPRMVGPHPRDGPGALFLLAFAGGLAGLYSLRPTLITPEGVVERMRRLKVGVVAMAITAWLTVLTGTWIVYPWYRERSPDSPRSQLLADEATAGWHEFGMEWKEHVAWISPILATVVAFIVLYYGTNLIRHDFVRRTAIILFVLAFVFAAVAGAFGAFITKVAPVI